MRVTDIRVVATAAACELQGLVESDRDSHDDEWFEPFDLWYRFPPWCEPFVSSGTGDPLLAALLLAAMRQGERLTILAPVSPKLLAALPDIQAIYAAFDPRATPIPVEANSRDAAPPATSDHPSTGLFFSLGVDSFYSLLKNQRDHPQDRKTVTHLIFVHGFETAYTSGNGTIPDAIARNVRRVAEETGTTPVAVETNVQRAVGRLAPWTMAHGGGLASVALALGGMLGRVTIAATTTYDRLYPWGTHPVLDPRWSTEGMTVIHDGCEMNTIDKTAIIARSPLALETLRVCPGFSTAYNCGQCVKCLRTMLDLMLAGGLDRCPTLPDRIDPTRLHEALRPGKSPAHIADFRRRLAALEAAGAPSDLCAALADHLALLQEGTNRKPHPRRGFVQRWRRRIAAMG